MNTNRRHTNRAVIAILVTAISFGSIAGCPSPAQVVAYAIAYQAFSFVLEETGEFVAKAAEAVRKAGIVALPFEGTPTDTPASGTLSLQPGKVQALPLPGSGKSLTYQSVSGSATVAVYISGAGSVNPCEDGTHVGSYELTITNGVVTIADSSLDLPASALAEAIIGVFSICLEVTSTVDVQLIIEELVVTFGPPVGTTPPVEQPPSEQPPSEQPPTETPAGFTAATIAHSSSEELLAGPTVDASVGFNLEHPFNVGGLALSGDGEKVWFWTYWHWSGTPPTDFVRIYSMNTDGSGLLRSELSMTDAWKGIAIATNIDGSAAVFELEVKINPGTFVEKGGSRFFLCTPGGAASQLYDTVDEPPASSAGQLRLNDNATRFFWRDMYNLWSVDVDFPGQETQLVTVDHLNFFGPWEPVTGGVINYFDIDASGGTWMTNVRFWNDETQTARYELVYGSGALPQNTYGITKAREGLLANIFNLSGDGSTVAYQCMEGGNFCYVTGSGGSVDLTATGLSSTVATTDVRLSDDASTAWFTYVSDGAIDGTTYSGVVLDIATGARRLSGPSFVSGSLDSWYSQISDNGGVMAGKWGCCRSEPLTHVWVLHDGVSSLPGFPTISNVSYRYDSEADALIVRVTASSPNGLERLVSYAHKNGVIVGGFIPSDQSPLHGEYATHFTAVEGTSDLYERTIYLGGKEGLLDGSHFLRVLAIDGLKSRLTYHDFAPVP